jgi:hypothetical protein
MLESLGGGSSGPCVPSRIDHQSLMTIDISCKSLHTKGRRQLTPGIFLLFDARSSRSSPATAPLTLRLDESIATLQTQMLHREAINSEVITERLLNYCRCVNGSSRSVKLLRIESVSWLDPLLEVGDEDRDKLCR